MGHTNVLGDCWNQDHVVYLGIGEDLDHLRVRTHTNWRKPEWGDYESLHLSPVVLLPNGACDPAHGS